MKRFKVLSLAALVAFAACDEGGDPIDVTPVTGTISGVVTIEGTARSGVSVTLSSGASATTDASGGYSFAAVAAGTYTVSISGFPTDATFTTTTKGATIATSGQVVTVNFDGAYVRTSAILGSVAAGGSGLSGVKVALTGATTTGASVNTDANGQYAFTGLRAGTYTVTISGFDATQYTFASTTSTVTVGVGQSQVASFNGTKVATAKITGTVTIEGAAAAGVTATLSTGATTTTDAAGAYTFSNLATGAYSVTISGYPSDAVFTSVNQAVTIATAGSTATANFAGTFLKTSSIVGTVSVSGTGLAGVTVTLNTGQTANTDTNGQYAFAALRAGTYTVTISGWNATMYVFATTSASVTVATGESAVQNFAGAYVATSGISGILFIDENDKNDTYDGATLEDTYMRAGVAISIEGGLVNDIQNTTTDANGAYAFANLVPGTYRVTITPPADGTFGWGGASTQALVTLAPGGAAVVNWPFDILRQYVRVSGFLGKDADVAAPAGVATGITPVVGWSLRLYDTQQNAQLNTATGRLGTATTGTDGFASFVIDRADDISPNSAVSDQIVYARVNGANPDGSPTLVHALNGESIIEIKYDPTDTLVMAPDTFDALYDNIVFKLHAGEIDFDTLAGWDVAMRANKDSTHATTLTDPTDADGDAYFTVNQASLAGMASTDGVWPDTLWFRLAVPQVIPTHPWTQTPSADEGTAAGRFLRYIWSGTVEPTDTIVLGAERVKYSTADVVVQVHRELDDSTGVPTYTLGDNTASVTAINAEVYRHNANGTKTSVGGPTAAAAGTGLVTFVNLDVTKTHEVRARSVDSNLFVLNDTLVLLALDGSDEVYTDTTLTGGAGNSTFAIKSNNSTVQGQVLAADGVSPAEDIIVTLSPTAGNIQGSATMVDTTLASGWYQFLQNVIEGPYTVTVTDIPGTWEFFTTLVVATNSGSADNSSPTSGGRDIVGYNSVSTANFRATRMDTEILGNIANDRDADLTTLDPNEALEGAVVRLYRDGSGATVSYDTMVAETTTDISGKYSFTGLREGRYAIRYISGGGSVTVLRAISKDSAVVTTGAAAGTGAQGTATVGTQTHTAANFLPRWNYITSTLTSNPIGNPDFTFLFTNTTVKGTVKTGGGVAVPGMTISLRRCNDSTGKTVTSPPTGADVCVSYLGTTVNMSSDAAGAFQFDNLVEGVYEIRPQPTTVAGWTTSAPAQILYITVGNGDIEEYNFVIS